MMVRLFFVLMCLPLAAQFNEMEGEYRVDQPVKKVLFLGNSYTYYHTLPRVLGKLAAQAEPATPMTLRWHTIPGATLEQLSSNPKVHHWLQQDWDLVVLQEQSTNPIEHPKKMFIAAKSLVGSIREQGAQPLFFMTWARAHKPDMIEALAASYTKISKKTGAVLAPVGRAWQLALKERPDLRLHQDDNSHPNPKGTYLSACVFYRVITGRDPRGLGKGGLDIDDPTAAYLQDIAARTPLP